MWSSASCWQQILCVCEGDIEMGTTSAQKEKSFTASDEKPIHRAPSIKHKPKPKRSYFDVGIGSVCLSGQDTGGAYCLLEAGLAPGMGVPRHTHTREDESYFVLVGELEVIVGGKTFVLRPGDSLVAPRDIPHQLRNSGDVENHYLLIFWPSGFEGFLEATAVPAPDNALAPTEPPTTAIRNVHELAAEFGILFG
jgi:quercetin dioxygenase-like cupin family protein